jgi:hypothetical protein
MEYRQLAFPASLLRHRSKRPLMPDPAHDPDNPFFS